PDTTRRYLREFAEAKLANVLGGCCGTTPEHIHAIAAAVQGLPPRPPAAPPAVQGLPPRHVPAPPTGVSRFSGLEPFTITPDTRFVMIGERTNITGSREFKSLIEAGDFTGGVGAGVAQVARGA